MIYLKLFWAFLQIGLFSIGGGYAALPLIQEQIVVINNWLTLDEYWDIVTISQMTPGPISINAATFVGVKLGGPFGAVVATFAFILPSVIIVSILYFIYIKYRKLNVINSVLAGLRPAVIGLIASAGVLMIISSFWGSEGITWNLSNIDLFAVVIFVACLFVIRKYKVNPIIVLSIAGAVGGIYSVL